MPVVTSQLSWNFTGPTPTPTLGIHLSCNFANVYTCASVTDILERILARKIAHRTSRVCLPHDGERSNFCGKLNGEVVGHAIILETILVRKSASTNVSVMVFVSTSWNAGFKTRLLADDNSLECAKS